MLDASKKFKTFEEGLDELATIHKDISNIFFGNDEDPSDYEYSKAITNILCVLNACKDDVLSERYPELKIDSYSLLFSMPNGITISWHNIEDIDTEFSYQFCISVSPSISMDGEEYTNIIDAVTSRLDNWEVSM